MHNQTQLGQPLSLRCWAWTICQQVVRQQARCDLTGLSRWTYKHAAWENRLACKATPLDRCLDLGDTSHRLPSNWWEAREGHKGLIPFLRRDFTFRPWVTSDALDPRARRWW